MKPIDLNKATEGYVRVITWNQQPVYLSRSTGGPGCFGPSANSLVASKMVFDPSDDTSGLKLRVRLSRCSYGDMVRGGC